MPIIMPTNDPYYDLFEGIYKKLYSCKLLFTNEFPSAEVSVVRDNGVMNGEWRVSIRVKPSGQLNAIEYSLVKPHIKKKIIVKNVEIENSSWPQSLYRDQGNEIIEMDLEELKGLLLESPTG